MGINGKAPTNGKDPIDAAIAATAEQPALGSMRQGGATIASTGRQAMILLPSDATDSEIAEFVGWVLGPVMATYRKEREQPRSGIIVPQPGHIVRA